MLRFAVLAAGLATLAPTAMAQCSDDQLQLVANRYYALSDASLKSGPIAEALRQDMVICATEPAAHKIAAMAFRVMAQRAAADGPTSLAFAEEAMREVLYMQAIMGSNPTLRFVDSHAGARTQIQFTDSYEVSKQAVHLLLATEPKAGRAIDFKAIMRQGDPAVRCDVYASSTAQQAAYWMKERKALTPGGAALVERMLAACKPEDYNGLSIRGYRIDLLLSLVEAAPGGPEALNGRRLAKADSDAIFAQRADGLHTGWKKSDLARLDRVTWKVVAANNTTLPMDQWFTAANLGAPMTAMIIAAQLDAAYAQDLAPGGVTAYTAYRAVLTPAYVAAKALPEPKAREARKMLYLAAKRHADGEWRRESNKSLKKPFDFLYNWVDPDYVAPPTPAPASPQ